MNGKNKKSDPARTERARKAALAEIKARIDAMDAPAPAATTPPVPADVAVPESTSPGPTIAGPDAAVATKPKKGGKPKAAKAAKPAKAPKAPKPAKEKKPKKVSLLDAAVTVLAGSKEPMSAKEIVADVLGRKMWSTKGETPEATLYAAMIREIAAKKGEARFKKVDRGLFVATPAGKGA